MSVGTGFLLLVLSAQASRADALDEIFASAELTAVMENECAIGLVGAEMALENHGIEAPDDIEALCDEVLWGAAMAEIDDDEGVFGSGENSARGESAQAASNLSPPELPALPAYGCLLAQGTPRQFTDCLSEWSAEISRVDYRTWEMLGNRYGIYANDDRYFGGEGDAVSERYKQHKAKEVEAVANWIVRDIKDWFTIADRSCDDPVFDASTPAETAMNRVNAHVRCQNSRQESAEAFFDGRKAMLMTEASAPVRPAASPLPFDIFEAFARGQGMMTAQYNAIVKDASDRSNQHLARLHAVFPGQFK